jgi:hypothetical protein
MEKLTYKQMVDMFHKEYGGRAQNRRCGSVSCSRCPFYNVVIDDHPDTKLTCEFRNNNAPDLNIYDLAVSRALATKLDLI